MKKIFQKIFNVRTIGLLFQGTFVPLTAGIPGGPNSSSGNLAGPLSTAFTQTSLSGLFQAAFNLALSAGAILAVLRLAYAGWLYMSSDAFGRKSHAKEVIMDAILGLVLLIGIYIILYQINPNLLNLNILQTVQGNSGSSGSVPSNITQISPM